MPDAFDVESTNAVKEDKLRDFLNSTLEPELGSIPMVGPATVKALEEAGIKNSFNLLGMFLMLKDTGATTQQHCDAFVRWWVQDAKAPKSSASAVTICIAQKCNMMIPGIYNEGELLLRADR